MTDENLAWEQAHGSGFQGLLGYRLVEWADGHAVVELEIADHHRNRAGILHGGALATLMDTAAGCALCYCPVPGHIRKCLTLSLTTNFIGAGRNGIIRVVARRSGGGRKIAFAEAIAYDRSGAVIGTASGSFKYQPGSENIEGVPRPA